MLLSPGRIEEPRRAGLIVAAPEAQSRSGEICDDGRRKASWEDSPDIELSSAIECEGESDGEEEERPRIDEVLKSLPLLDDLYVGMQAMNLTIVDSMIEEMEGDLLAEYTPRANADSERDDRFGAQPAVDLRRLRAPPNVAAAPCQDVLKFVDKTATLAPDPREAQIAAKEASLHDPNIQPRRPRATT